MTHTAAAGKPPADHIYRGKLLRLIHAGLRTLAIDQAAKEDILQRQFGKTSFKELRTSQLREFADKLCDMGFKPKPKAPVRAGSRPLAESDMARKVRALWLSLYHLGVVTDPREAAIAAFVKRQTGRDALAWLDGRDAARVIEPLKAMATRDAGVDWTRRFGGIGDAEIQDDRYCVAITLWEELRGLDLVGHHGATLQTYGYSVTGVAAYHFYEAEHWSRLLEALGGKRRQVLKVRHG